MRYTELAQKLASQGIFSVNEARAIEPGFYRPRLNEWQKKGYIKKFIRNYYIFSSAEPDERFLFAAANRVYPPSYISMQSALAYYGLIPERPLSVTSITTRKTKSFNTPFGRLSYRKAAVKLFWGYNAAGREKDGFLIASPAKALIDLLYLDASLRTAQGFAGLRLNMKRMQELEPGKNLQKVAAQTGNPRIIKIIKEVF